MGKLIPLSGARAAPRVERRADVSAISSPRRDSNYELLPMALLLFTFSLARVAYAVWKHEPFETEPTLALACVLGLPCLAWRLIRKGS